MAGLIDWGKALEGMYGEAMREADAFEEDARGMGHCLAILIYVGYGRKPWSLSKRNPFKSAALCSIVNAGNLRNGGTGHTQAWVEGSVS